MPTVSLIVCFDSALVKIAERLYERLAGRYTIRRKSVAAAAAHRSIRGQAAGYLPYLTSWVRPGLPAVHALARVVQVRPRRPPWRNDDLSPRKLRL